MATGQQEALALLADQQKRLDASNAPELKLELDFNHFISQERFKAHRHPEQLLHQLVSHVVEKGLWAPGEGLVPWLGRSERAKRLFAERTQRCLIRMDSAISDVGKGNSYFTVRYDGTTMVVTARMDCLAYTDGWGVKVDEQLDLNVLDEQNMKEALIKITQHEAKLRAGLGGGAAVEVDWASFVRDEKFQRMKDPARKSVIHNIADCVVEKGLFDSGQGLLKWASNSKRVRRLFLERVNKIVIKLEPHGSLDNVGIGNSYYKVQEQAATSACAGSSLIVTARMDCLTYTDGWGPKIDECLGWHYLDETYMRQALDALAAKTAKLHGDLTGSSMKQPALRIDWDSFVSDGKFLRQRESARKSVFEQVVESVIQKGVWASDGLLAFCREHPEVAVGAIVVKLVPDGSLVSGTGNSYYRVYVSDGPTVTVSARMDCLAYTDGWKTKLNSHLAALQSAKATAQAEVPPHAYVADQSEPVPLPAATVSALHEYLIVPGGEVSAPQVSEGKLARETANAEAQAKAEEDARRDRVEQESRMKREAEEAPAALRARQADVSSTAGSAAGPSAAKLPAPAVPSPSSPSLGAAASIPGAQDALKRLQSTQAALDAALGGLASAVEFAVDWSFAQDAAYASLPPPQQTSCVDSNLTNAVGLLSRGLVALARDDTIKQALLSRLVSRVVLEFDTSNSINSRITGSDQGRHYELGLRGGELRMRINFGQRSDTLWSLEDKLRCALNLQLKQSQAEMSVELSKMEQKLASAGLGGVGIEVDWASFAESEAFLGKPPSSEGVLLSDLKRQRDIVASLRLSYIQSVVTGSEGLVRLCQDDVFRAAILERVKTIVFRLDPTDSVKSASSSSSSSSGGRTWDLRLEPAEERVVVTVDLSSVKDSVFGTKEQWDQAMQVRTAQGIRDAEGKIAQLVGQLQGQVGKKIDVVVDWRSFVDHASFAALPLAQKTALLANVLSNHVGPATTGYDGLGTKCRGDEIFKQAVSDRIDRVEFAYDPANSVNGLYSVQLGEDRVLAFTINFDQCSCSLGGLKARLDEVINVKVAQQQRDAEKDLLNLQTALSNALGQPVQVKVDWAFTQHEQFLAKSLQERAKVCALATERCGALVGRGDGLVGVCDREPTSKGIIAGAVKAVVFSVDPTSASEPVGDEYGWYYSVALAADELRLTYNMDALDQPPFSFYGKLDTLLQLSVTKALHVGKPTLEALGQRLRSKGLAIDVAVDCARFQSSPEFKARSAKQKCELVTQLIEERGRSLVEGADHSIFTACDSVPAARDWLKAQVSRVVLTYDPTSSIDDTVSGRDQGKAYALKLDDAGTLAFITNMDDHWFSLHDFSHKLLAQLCFADARRGRYAPELEKCAKRMAAAAGKPVALSFDWASLDTRAFLYDNPLPTLQARLHQAFADPAGLMGCLVGTVEQVCSTPMGKQAFAATVESVVVTVGHDSTHTAVVLRADEKRLEVIAVAQLSETGALDAATWRADLELALGQTIPIAKHCALQSLKQVEDEAASLLGKRVSVTIDWTHADAPQTQTRPDTIVAAGKRIHTLANELARRVVIQGLAAVCDHPVGRCMVHQSVDSVVLRYDPAHGRHGTVVAVDAAAKTITIHTDDVAGAVHERFKELIEFELDLVVRIAESNAQALHDAAQSAVSAAVGRPVKVEADLGFTSLDVFRRLPPAQQADIVTALCAALPESALVRPEGLGGVVAHAVGKSAVASAIDAVLFAADVEGKKPPKGSIALDGRQLRVTLNLDEVLSAAQWTDWKARLADAVGVLLPIAQTEAQTALGSLAAQLSAALGRPTTVQVRWEAFVATREWSALDAEAKLASAAALAGLLAQQALLGDQGLAALAEFDGAKSSVNQHAQSVQLVLDPAATRVGVAANAGVLTLGFPLAGATNVAEFRMPSVRALVENALNLKPAIEAAVVQEVNEKVAIAEKKVAAALGKPITIKFDWDALLRSELYNSTEDYVAFLRERIAPMPSVAFAGGGESLESLLKDNSSARSAMQAQFAEVVLRVDTHNQCRPPQHRFIPQHYLAEAVGTTLVVNMRLDFGGAKRGCGPVVEWILCPELAAAKEREEVGRIAAARREEELLRRERELKRVQQENAHAATRHADKLRRYESDLKKYEKQKGEKHSPCHGTGWVKCQNYWHRNRNPILAKCPKCHGKGGHTCMLCKGTGLKFPKLEPPKQPEAPKTRPLPTFPPISSIDFTRNIA